MLFLAGCSTDNAGARDVLFLFSYSATKAVKIVAVVVNEINSNEPCFVCLK